MEQNVKRKIYVKHFPKVHKLRSACKTMAESICDIDE